MKKIFGFIGSPLKTKSNTYNLAKMMLDKLVEKDGEISYELLTAGDVNVKYCMGCWSCMTRGICPQDKKDDMKMLKEKMLEADAVLWGSPVYTMQVSGQMKTFMDRLAAWYHLIRLAGKPGISVVTTASGGLKEVHDFIEMLLGVLGVKVVAKLDTYAYFPGIYRDKDAAMKNAQEAAEVVYPYIIGEKLVETDEYMEECFQAMKHKIEFGSKWLQGDYNFWKEHGMLGLNSYGELLEKIRRKN